MPQSDADLVRPMVDPKHGSPAEIMANPPERLTMILDDPGASVYAKAKACQQLAVTGGPASVPSIAKLLADPELSHYARFALEPMPGPEAGAALREALGKARGMVLVGVINSIGVRRDEQAVDALSKLRGDDDRDVAEAAEAALQRMR